MPKLIENLRSDLLATARHLLQTEGYEALTIRKVAAQCNIALGTTYNYFPSKDVLTAAAMLEDWKSFLERLHTRCAAATSPLQGLRLVYDCIVDFTALYQRVWREYSVHAGTIPFIRAQHKALIHQLAAEIEPVLERHDCLYYSHLPDFLADALLSAAVDPEVSFDDLIPILYRLCQPL